MTSNGIVQELWNYCNILRNDGLSYGDYVDLEAPAPKPYPGTSRFRGAIRGHRGAGRSLAQAGEGEYEEG